MTMSTIMKTTLIAVLLLGLAPAAQARQGGTQPDLPRYGWPVEQQRAYQANQPGWVDHARWSNPNARANAYAPANAYAQQPPTRVTPGTVRRNGVIRNRVISDDPPGAAFQDQGFRENLGYPPR